MMTYGILTPGSNGISIALGGSMLAVTSAAWVVGGLVPQVVPGQGGENTVLAGRG
jgi:hypothetical protein